VGIKSKTLNLIAILAITVLFFAMIEGLSSFLLSANDFSSDQSEERSGITQFDSSLGWVGDPGLFVKDEYGDGKFVQINENGFRDSNNTSKAVSDGQIRAICSGDSFTFGQGVANDSTWCHLLSNFNSALATVNLGQNGYGVDQMYLRYIEDGLKLEHSIHIFAFISSDLDRMSLDSHYGYGKPMLKIDSDTGTLITKNTPVPKMRWDLHRLVRRVNLRSVEFLQRLTSRFSSSEINNSKLEEVGPVASKVMIEVHRNAVERNIIPIFIYLPTQRDLVKDASWRLWAKKNMQQHNLNFLDLTPILRALPAGEVSTFFIPQNNRARGHYTEAGNKWAAETIFQAIHDFAGIKDLLNRTDK